MAPKGQRRSGTARDRIWQSIRIFRRFTIPDLMRTGNASYRNTGVYVRALEVHGVITREAQRTGGQPGSYTRYRLVRETILRPMICTRCGKLILDPQCAPDDGEVAHD